MEKSTSENYIGFLNAKREKTKIKFKINLIYDSKLKFDGIGIEIKRKT